MGYQRVVSSDPPLTVGPAAGVVCIRLTHSKYHMTPTRLSLHIDRAAHRSVYTVYDREGCVCIVTESYRVAYYYFRLCALGVLTHQMAQLDTPRRKAPLRKI